MTYTLNSDRHTLAAPDLQSPDLPSPDLPSLDAKTTDTANAHRAMWFKVLLGIIWMAPVGYFLTHGQGHAAQLDTMPAFAPHVKTLSITVRLASVASVLAMVIQIRRSFAGKASLALAIGMMIGFVAGCGPAELMAQLGR